MDTITIIAIIASILSLVVTMIYMLSMFATPFINKMKIKLRRKFTRKSSFVLENIDTVTNVHILNSRKPPYSRDDEEQDVERFKKYVDSPMYQFMKLTKYADIKQWEK